MDPRVEFISQVLTQILIRFHLRNLPSDPLEPSGIRPTIRPDAQDSHDPLGPPDPPEQSDLQTPYLIFVDFGTRPNRPRRPNRPTRPTRLTTHSENNLWTSWKYSENQYCAVWWGFQMFDFCVCVLFLSFSHFHLEGSWWEFQVLAIAHLDNGQTIGGQSAQMGGEGKTKWW